MSKKSPSPTEVSRLREQLRGASPSADLPYDLRWARRTLDGEEVAPPEVVREDVVSALTEELSERLDAQTLTRLAGSGHKAVSKAARTGLHRLRSQKVAVQVPQPTEAPRSGTGLLEEAELQGLITMYDGRGQRVVWLAMPASKGILLHQARISAAYGLIDFETYSSTRRRYGQLLERVGDSMLTASIPRPLAHWFIEQSTRLGRQHLRGVPPGYSAASQMLGAPPEHEHPALAMAPAAAEPAALTALFEDRSLSLWTPDRTFMQQLSLRLQEVATSRIMVDDKQRAAQLGAIIERAVEEYHTAEHVAAARQLLLDTAHLVSLTGGPAALVRQAADIYLQPPAQVIAHPFARAFIERLVQRPPQAGPPEERSEGGLVLPGR